MFSLKMVVKKFLRKGRKLYATLMVLENTYDRVDREPLWSVLRRLLEGIKAFYRGASACERVT